MTDPERTRRDTPADAPRGPGLHVDALPAEATGCWVVRTVHTTHLFDLDDTAYTRLPGPGRREMPHDGTWLRLLRFGIRPTVGASFLLFVDDPDPAVAAFFEFWRVSSTVVSIEAATRDQLDRLRTTPPGGDAG